MGAKRHWNRAFILKFSAWVLYCKKVVKNKSVEKLISILPVASVKSKSPKGAGNRILFCSIPTEKFPHGCTR